MIIKGIYVEVTKGTYAGHIGVADKVYTDTVVVNINGGPLVSLSKESVRAF